MGHRQESTEDLTRLSRPAGLVQPAKPLPENLWAWAPLAQFYGHQKAS